MLQGDKIFLRVVEANDATTLYLWENNPENWKVSNTEVPFSMHGIHALIDSQKDFRECGQLRFIICEKESGFPVGTIDLYDVNFKHGFASVGILIAEEKQRRNGYATESLNLIMEYARDILELRNLQCSIHGDNLASVDLFQKSGFEHIGTRKNWLRFKGVFYDEMLFQKCLNAV
jgi:diamine N-acetyltransferase